MTANVESVIEQYFLLPAGDRPLQCKVVAQHITTFTEVILVLDWGNTQNKEVYEAYDSAIDLLAQLGEFLIEFIDSKHVQSILKNTFGFYETEFEILITALSLSDKLSFAQKLEGIIKMMPSPNRLVKAAIVDALLDLKDEFPADIGILQSHLVMYSSEHEPDEYIRLYAKTALDELTTCCIIKLNKEDSEAFLKLLENPPLPNEALMKAAARYKATIASEDNIPAAKKPPTLEELMEKVTPENTHPEVDWGSDVGLERWWEDEAK
jgi:hypothetical protein